MGAVQGKVEAERRKERGEKRGRGREEEADAGVTTSRSLIPLSHCLLFFKPIIVIGGPVKES